MTAINSRHSADVRMRLLLRQHTLPIAQMGPNFLILGDTVDHPPADADIVLSVDGHARQWTVHLPNGLQAGQKHVLITRPQAEV